MRQRPHHPDSPLVRLLRDPGRELRQQLALLQHALTQALPYLAALAGLALALTLALWLLRRQRARRLAEGARLVRIAVPPELDPQAADVLWKSLHDLLRPPLARLLQGQPHLAWEIAADRAGSAFRLWIPRAIPPGLVERALLSAWPGASIHEDDATPTSDGDGTLVCCELHLSEPHWRLLGRSEGTDPLRLVLGQLAGLEQDERALVQLLARPATSREQARLLSVARRLRAGQPLARAQRLLDLLGPAPATARRPSTDPTIAPEVREALAKASQPLFRALVRLAVLAPTAARARGRIHALCGAFAAYEGSVGLRRRHLWNGQHKLAQRRLGRGASLLSSSELAALAHLPEPQALPGLVRAGARSVPPPAGLPEHGKPLGVDARGEPVTLAIADARYHLHLLGPTGVGKSTLLARLALDDLKAGHGAVVVDPKGDLVEDLLARIPDGLEEQVDLLDPLDPAPPGLNVLEGEDADLVTDQLVGIFRRVYEQFWGPRTDDILRAALLTLLASGPGATLADVPRLLSDERFREQLLAELDDPVGLEPFWEWYEQLSEPLRAQATGPVLNKLRAFLLRRNVRAIVGQQRSSVDVPRVLDHGRLLLVRVPKGTLGEDTSRLLGSFAVARVWQAALARARRAEHERPECALYIDEVQSYLTLPSPLADMLAEARGYHLSLCLAHQHLGQLPREMREAIAANARTKLYFQLSLQDAHSLARELEPELGAHDLANLPRHTAAVRLCHNGETGRPFTLQTDPLPARDPDRADAVRQASRARIGVAREDVEDRLAQRGRTSRRGGLAA
jgi:Type IV secretion-system coupling protein DNA-binding domain/TraM recognition site of TraD and TraG